MPRPYLLHLPEVRPKKLTRVSGVGTGVYLAESPKRLNDSPKRSSHGHYERRTQRTDRVAGPHQITQSCRLDSLSRLSAGIGITTGLAESRL